MRNFKLTLYLTLLLTVKLYSNLNDGKVYVVANQSLKIDSLRQSTLVKIFVGKKVIHNNFPIHLVLKDNKKLFLNEVLKMSHQLFDRRWKRLVYTGQKKIYITSSSDEKTIEEILKNPGGIGFITDKSKLSKGIVLVEITDK